MTMKFIVLPGCKNFFAFVLTAGARASVYSGTGESGATSGKRGENGVGCRRKRTCESHRQGKGMPPVLKSYTSLFYLEPW